MGKEQVTGQEKEMMANAKPNMDASTPTTMVESTTTTDANTNQSRRCRPLSSSHSISSSTSFRLRSPSLNSVRLRRIFDIFDKNKDGLISPEELTQALNLLGLDTDLCDLESLVRSYIQPGQLGLRFEDFEALHRSINEVFFVAVLNQEQQQDDESMQEESDLCEAFKVFDEDGDGYISAKELQVVLGKLGLYEDDEEGKEMKMDRVEMMISSVDLNHDGLVDFFEFKDMMRSVIVRSA